MSVVKKIDNSDFEFYSVKLPLIIRKNKRNAFLSKELEKKHPCFSDRCWWKPKLKYTGKGFVASIAVMDKVKLARYKEENPGKIFEFNEKNKRIFFLEKEVLIRKILFVVFVAITLLIVFLGTENSRNENEISAEETAVPSKIIKEEETCTDICTEVLKDIQLHDGTITLFSAGINLLKLDVYGCYPEDIRVKKLITSELLFKNNVPYFSVQKKIDTVLQEDNNLNESFPYENMSHIQIRNLLLEKKVKLINENIEQNSFEFETEDFISVINEIYKILKNSGCGLKELLVAEQNNTFLLKISITEQDNILTEIIPLLNDARKVFHRKIEEKIKSVPYKKESRLLKKSESKIEDTWEKVGTVSLKNKIYEFYKDSEGKIRRFEK